MLKSLAVLSLVLCFLSCGEMDGEPPSNDQVGDGGCGQGCAGVAEVGGGSGGAAGDAGEGPAGASSGAGRSEGGESTLEAGTPSTAGSDDAAGASGAMAGGGSAGMSDVPCTPLATADQLEATPRADENLELLAVVTGSSVTANQTTYERVVRDVANIRALAPEVAQISYFSSEVGTGRTINLTMEPSALSAVADGEYHAWDCLNQVYELTDEPAMLGTDVIQLTFEGLYDTRLIAEQYLDLPGVLSAGPTLLDPPPMGFSTICLLPEGDTWHYVFVDAPNGSGCCDSYYFVTEPDGSVEQRTRWLGDQGTQRPNWVIGSLAACPDLADLPSAR